MKVFTFLILLAVSTRCSLSIKQQKAKVQSTGQHLYPQHHCLSSHTHPTGLIPPAVQMPSRREARKRKLILIVGLLKDQPERESKYAVPVGTSGDTNEFSFLVSSGFGNKAPHFLPKLEKSFSKMWHSKGTCSHCHLYPVPRRRAHSWSVNNINPFPYSQELL